MINWVFKKGDRVRYNGIMDKDKPIREQQLIVHTVLHSTAEHTSLVGIDGEWPTMYFDLRSADGLHFNPLFWLECEIDRLMNGEFSEEKQAEADAIKRHCIRCLSECWGIEVSTTAPCDSTGKPVTVFTKAI